MKLLTEKQISRNAFTKGEKHCFEMPQHASKINQQKEQFSIKGSTKFKNTPHNASPGILVSFTHNNEGNLKHIK